MALAARKRSSDYYQKDGTGLVAVRVKATTESISLAMRLTAAILLIGALNVNARGIAQKVSITGTNLPLSAVFHAIEDQTGYGVLMEKSTLEAAKPVSISLTNGSIDEVMKVCFSFQPWKLKYSISGKTISVAKVVETAVMQHASEESPQIINGVVRNENGSPLAGATIEIKTLNKTGLTNEKGEFSFKGVPNGTYRVEVSYVGYDKYSVEVNVQNHLFQMIVDLKQASNKLDRVEVIAYGTTTQRLSTGNISSVKAADIEKQPVNNPLLALEGRVPGLFIAQTSGLPGAGVTVNIQGQNSIGSGNEPLYVIDGVPYTSQSLVTNYAPQLGGAGQQASPFFYINPSDIESISILKDADATAIYGSRAANGAVLITTRKGKAGQTKFDLNLQNGWGQVTRKLDVLNTQQYLQMRHEALKNDRITSPSASDYDINGFWDTTRYTDWQKTLIGGTSQYNNINGTVSGGNANTQFLIGATYHRETTVFPGTSSNRKVSMHFNINNSSANQKFHIQLSGNYLVDNDQMPGTDYTYLAITTAPDAPPIYSPDGTLNWAPNASGSSTWTNPLSALYQTYQNKTNNIIGNCILGYQIFPGLELKSSFGYTNLQTNELLTSPSILQRPEDRPFVSRSALYTNNSVNSWIIEPQINYNRVDGKGKVGVTVGTTIQQKNTNGQKFDASGYSNDQVLADISSAGSIDSRSTVILTYKYNGLYGRINYSWLDKYIVNLTARRDGSSRFGSQSQFHNFGSTGVAWIFTQENFIRNNLPILSFGKLRASFGTTGNDQIGDYRYLNLYGPYTVGTPYQNTAGLIVNNLPNPYLQWEETQKLQSGIDLGLFKDRILINANYVHNRSSNQLLSYALPSITGFNGIVENFPATVQNTAWEFALNTTNLKTKDFSWSSSLNLTIPKNKLVAFPNLAKSSYATSLFIGQPVSILKAFHFLGVNDTTGIYQFADFHGNTTTAPDQTTDMTSLVNTLPKFYGGIENSFSYKGFQLDILFQFVKQMGPNYLFGLYPGARKYNEPVSVLGRWQKPGDQASIQRFNSDYTYSNSWFNATQSDAAYSDASYIRLKNLSLSYQMPEKWRQKAHLPNCRIYAQGQNLLTFTNYKGMDPENQSASAHMLPPLRVITIGLQAGL